MNRFPGPYWIIYYLAYLIAVAILLGLYWDGLLNNDGNTRIFLLAAIFGAGGGAAVAFTILVEGGGRIVLLIPKAAKDLIDKGRAEGRAEGHEAGRAEGHEAGRAEGHEAGRAERDARYEEAYRRFGVEVDGVVVLPRTPEVQAFLEGESG